MSELQTLHDRFCQYSIVFKGNSKKSISWMKYDFKNFLEVSGITEVKNISQHVIEDWIIKGKIDRQWAPQTIRLHLQSMSLFLDWCVAQNLIKENPTKRIPRPKLPSRVPQHLTVDQATSLLEWTRSYPYVYKFERYRAVAIIAMFIYSGVRKDELRELKLHDIDFDNRTILVRKGKGLKDRIIPLHYKLETILHNYLKDRKRLNKACPYFFTAMRQDSRMGENAMKRLIIKIRERSGIYFYPHILRHTFATLMLEGGCNLFALSKMLGHSDIKTTTIYLSATQNHMKDQITKHPLDF